MTPEVEVTVKRDPEQSHPIATAWRSSLRCLVARLARGEVESPGLQADSNDPIVTVSPRVADQIRAYLSQFGQTLCALPEDTWSSSVAQWMEGYWDIVVDLWTVEAGRSDLVLSARVFEDDRYGYRIEVHGVYVP